MADAPVVVGARSGNMLKSRGDGMSGVPGPLQRQGPTPSPHLVVLVAGRGDGLAQQRAAIEHEGAVVRLPEVHRRVVGAGSPGDGAQDVRQVLHRAQLRPPLRGIRVSLRPAHRHSAYFRLGRQVRPSRL